jgi:ribosomal protein L11 methyltransferase
VGNYLEKDGLFIGSGIVLDRLDEVKEFLEGNRFKVLEILTEGEWVAIVCQNFL